MMAQWHQCKAKSREALLLFRLGDFYEAFYEDAHTLAKELELTLTQRQGIPMSGIPSQTIENYLEKLVAKGYLVAVAEQVEDARFAKGIVKRAITRIVSPATHLQSSLIKEKSNNYFASLAQVNRGHGLCLIDLTTGEASVTEVEEITHLFDELMRRTPSEILISTSFYRKNKEAVQHLKDAFPLRVNVKEDYCFDHQSAYKWLTSHFQVHTLDGLGLKGMVSAINAAGALFAYLVDDLHLQLSHIRSLKPDPLSSYMSIDHTTQRNLDLPLLEIHLDRTETPMGGRLLKRWFTHPLLSQTEIEKRQTAIEELIPHADKILQVLKPIRDLERLIMRTKTANLGPRDLLALAYSLEQIPRVNEEIKPFHTITDLSHVAQKIKLAIVETAPLRLTEGGIFKPGYHSELDELRTLKENSQAWLAGYQTQLRDELDIKTLKVSYTRAFGYFIEVSRGQSGKMPASFLRRQTLVNAERFISPALKEYEEKILGAEEKIAALEYQCFTELREEIATYADAILDVATKIATIDCLTALAALAKEYHYTKPIFDNTQEIELVAGRHPVIEASLPDERFIPNDTFLNKETQNLLVITGPNMAGKSTYIRQVALIVIMAQIGSFVPAKKARLCIVDKVFSRIGAHDDLSRGQSTFMVEMTETANILNNATSRSLVILDEIGRGTSTYDGIAIAWAVAEHLLTIGAKTLFATHFWELTKLSKEHKQVKNFTVAVQENEDGILFLHKILKGDTDKSYGIHVAKLAGLPLPVIKRAQKLLSELEEKKTEKKLTPPQKKQQFLLFAEPEDNSSILQQLQSIDIGRLTPLEALTKIAKWKDELRS